MAAIRTIKNRNTTSPWTPSDERSGGSTTHPDDHGHQHRDHHPRRQHDEDIHTSDKGYSELTRPTSTKAALPSSTASNAPPIGSTPLGASGKGSKAQGSQVRSSTSVDKFLFDLSMAWVAVGMLRAHGGVADESGGPSGRPGVDANGGGWARPRSVSGRTRIPKDNDTSGVRRPEPAISYHSGIKRPQLSKRSDISVEGGGKDGLSIALENNPETETTVPSSSSSDAGVVGSKRKTDGANRVSPPTAAAAAAAAVARTGEDPDNSNDPNREDRLLRAGDVLGDMRQKETELSAVTAENGRRGTRGWGSWRARRHHQGQGEPSAGRRLGEREAALGEKGGLVSVG